MKTYKNLWQQLCTFENLEHAYEQAKLHKSANPKIMEFEKHWRLNLCVLLKELQKQTYKPQPLKKFLLRDPKTRIICISDFRDRVIHHALVNILKPIFDPRFIYDSYASRKLKGTLPALQRLDYFKRKVTLNGELVKNARNANWVKGFALKADIKHYFETVNHQTLLDIIQKYVKDEKIMWLTKTILCNYDSGIPNVGMPLGNWTSQFFANIYLNELDQYAKHVLKTKYYIRYVDDFVILHRSKKVLYEYKQKISEFLKNQLKLELHPNKSKISPMGRGISMLGFRVFYEYKILRKTNLRKIQTRLKDLLGSYKSGNIDAYDVLEVLQGWNGYAMQGNTHRLRQKLEEEVKKNWNQEQKTRRPLS